MPTLSRIRIINFKYNDGKRRIADDTFNFNFNSTTNNALLKLENGGGKSVLVQLMMQPLVPKVSLCERKIGDYFKKNSDASYIMLEWKLDNSNDYITTGIALAPSEGEVTNEKTVDMKYFTFTALYGKFGNSDYDINNIELCKKEDSKFTFLQYRKAMEYVKDLSKKNNHNVMYFHSENVESYYKYLDNFNIPYKEFKNVVAAINNHEHGVVDIFEKYKTSDKLLDEFLIDAIDRNSIILSNANNEEGSLSVMMMNYAKTVLSHEEDLKNRDLSISFKEELESFLRPAQRLSDLTNGLNEAVGNLYSFSKSVEDLKIMKENEIELSIIKRNEIKTQLERIHFEQSSFEYIEISDKFEELSIEYKNQEDVIKNLKEELHVLETDLKIQHARKLYYKFREADMRRQSILKTIEDIENKTDSKELIKSLKYSIFIKSEQKEAECNMQLMENNNKIKNININIADAIDNKNICETKLHNLSNESGKLEEKLNSFEENTEVFFNSIGIKILPRLDGIYDLIDINSSEKDLISVVEFEENEIEKLIDKKQELNNLLDDTTNNKTKLEKENIRLKIKFEALKSKSNDYYLKENQIKEILERHFIPFESRFEKSVIRGFNNKLKEYLSEMRKLENENSILKDKINATENGCMHVSPKFTGYLDCMNIKYETGENWLQNQEVEIRENILNIFPALVYSVIVFDKDLDLIFNNMEGLWLGSLGIITTYEDLCLISSNEGSKYIRSNIKLISCYEKKVFENRSTFINNLNNCITKTVENINSIFKNIQIIEKDIKTLSDFDFTNGYIEKIENEIFEIENILENNLLFIDKLDKNIPEIKSDLKQIDNTIYMEKNKCTRAQENVDKFKNWYKNDLKLFYSIKEKINTVILEINDIKTQLDNNNINIEKSRIEMQHLIINETDIKEIVKKLKNYSEKFNGVEKTEILEEGIDELIIKYETQSSSINKELSDINLLLNETIINIQDINEDINKTKISVTDYSQGEYLKQYEIEIEEKIPNLKILIEAAENNGKELYGKKNQYEGMLNSKHSEIKLHFKKDPLMKSEIAGSFSKRILENKEMYNLNESTIIHVEGLLNDLKYIIDRNNEKKSYYNYSGEITKIEIKDNISDQANYVYSVAANAINERKEEVIKLINKTDMLLSLYGDKGGYYTSAVKALKQQISDIVEPDNDRYHSFVEIINEYCGVLDKNISYYNQRLTDIDENRNSVVMQCLMQGRTVYEQLNIMSKCSEVKLPEITVKKRMLRVEMPADIDEDLARNRIESYIDNSVEEIIIEMRSGVNINDISKKIANKMSSRNLLNQYIGTEVIPIKVYKIDVVVKNSDYRYWEDAIKGNSGGEKFVVFFAVILSLMYYSRTGGDYKSDGETGTLIMDNPFGPISSAHLLKPMFAIAKRFDIQLICLSDLDKMDIISCFNLVYKIKIKQIMYGSNEMLEFSRAEMLDREYEEEFEHAFYKGSQTSLF